jgi:Protein of unknown function (DUF1364)
MNLRKLAKGQECQIRLEGICNFNPETTILAHFRISGISGMGIKSPDWLGAWACSDCHRHVDHHRDAQTQLDFAKGVFRTQAMVFSRLIPG